VVVLGTGFSDGPLDQTDSILLSGMKPRRRHGPEKWLPCRSNHLSPSSTVAVRGPWRSTSPTAACARCWGDRRAGCCWHDPAIIPRYSCAMS